MYLPSSTLQIMRKDCVNTNVVPQCDDLKFLIAENFVVVLAGIVVQV